MTIKTVENEEVHTIQEDKTLKVNKDFNTIVKRDKKTYIEKDLIDSIKNVLHTYIEGDVSDKYLENFFVQVGLEMGVDISGSFHLETTSVKEQASDISEIIASQGISLKCGGNVLTINSAGIHFKTPNYNDNSANGGLDASEVLYEGDIINARITNDYGTAISKQLDNSLLIQADTGLKDGRNIEVKLYALNKDNEIIAQEIKNTSVKNSKISQSFNIDDFIKNNNLEEDEIIKYSGEVNVK